MNAAGFWSDMDSTSRLGDIHVQHRVSSHHQLVCMMASHAVASWSHYLSVQIISRRAPLRNFTRLSPKSSTCSNVSGPASNVLENRSYFLICTQMFRLWILVLKNKCASQKQMAGVLAINVEKCSDVSQAAMGGRETNMKSCTSG